MSAPGPSPLPGRLRALLRIELRNLRRHPARAWLVVLLVALPVAAMVGGSTWLTTTRRTPADLADVRMGQASLRAHLGEPGEGSALVPALPEATRQLALTEGWLRASVPGRSVLARLLAAPAGALESDGLARGMAALGAGRWPRDAEELALAPVVCELLDVELGDRFPFAGRRRTLVGRAVDPEDLSAPLAVLAVADPHAEELVGQLVSAARVLLLAPVEAARTAELAQALASAGVDAVRRADVAGSDALETLILFVVGGFGLVEAALVIAAAFAVGLRRRQRELGLLGATGAPAGALQGGVLASAAVLSALGGVLGAVLGLAVAALLQPWWDDWHQRLNGPLQIAPLELLGAVLLGVSSAVGAVWWPARVACRRPVRESLAGRRPAQTGGGGWLVAGLACVAAGVGLVSWGATLDGSLLGVALLGGSVLSLVGFGLASPGLLGRAATLAAPLPLAWRLAVRDAGRFRSRHGPVVTAVLAGMALSVLVAALLESIDGLTANQRPSLADDVLRLDGPASERLASEVAAELDAARTLPWAAVSRHGRPVLATLGDGAQGTTWILWGTPELLASRGLPTADQDELLLLDQADSVTPVELLGAPVQGWQADPRRSRQPLSGPPLVLGARRARAAGFDPGPPPGASGVPWLVQLGQRVDADALQRATALAAAVPGMRVDAARLHRRADGGSAYRAVLLVSLLTGLVVIAIATALTAVESASDAHVLHCVGAGPDVLSRIVAARAAWLALLGCALAIPAGLVPAYGLLGLSNPEVGLVFRVPWLEVGLTVVGLPLLAWSGTWLVARRSGPPARPPPLTL